MPTQTFFDLDETKKQRILAAAYAEFADQPYEKVSIQSIIRSASIPRGSFYQYFTDKEDLYLYCQSALRQKIMDMVFMKEGIDFYWHRIYSPDTSKDVETEWFKNFNDKIQSLLTEHEFRFANTFSTSPHNILVTSLCQDALSIYYPYFSQVLEKEHLSPDLPNRDILAFFLAMGDFLAYEYSYVNHVSDQDAFALIRLGLKTLVDAYRANAPVMIPDPIENSMNFLTEIQARLNALELVSIHFMSKSGTDILIPVSCKNKWELSRKSNICDCILRIPTDGMMSDGSLSLHLHDVHSLCDLASGSDSTKADANDTGYLTFSYRDNTKDHSHIACHLVKNGLSFSLGASDLIGIGTRQNGTKVCLIENGNFVL